MEKANLIWEENCYTNFLAAVDDGSYQSALECIGDMADVNPTMAMMMRKFLNDCPLDKFTHPSHYHAV